MNKSTLYRCRSLVTSHTQNNVLYLWYNLFLKELINSPLNNRKGIAIVVGKPVGTLWLNTHRPGVHIQYYRKDVKGGRVIYGTGSSTVATDPSKFITKPLITICIKLLLAYTSFYTTWEVNYP